MSDETALCMSGMRIRVADLLKMPGEGVSADEILADFPGLEREDDIHACLKSAVRFTQFLVR